MYYSLYAACTLVYTSNLQSPLSFLPPKPEHTKEVFFVGYYSIQKPSTHLCSTRSLIPLTRWLCRASLRLRYTLLFTLIRYYLPLLIRRILAIWLRLPRCRRIWPIDIRVRRRYTCRFSLFRADFVTGCVDHACACLVAGFEAYFALERLDLFFIEEVTILVSVLYLFFAGEYALSGWWWLFRGWGYHGRGFRDDLGLFDEGLLKPIAVLGDLGCFSRDWGLVDP